MFPCPFARTCCWWGTTHARTLPIVAVWHGPSTARLCYHQCVSLRPLPIQHLAQPSCTAIQGEGNAAVHSRFVKSRKAICFTPSCLVQAPCGPDSRGRVHPMPVCEPLKTSSCLACAVPQRFRRASTPRDRCGVGLVDVGMTPACCTQNLPKQTCMAELTETNHARPSFASHIHHARAWFR